MKLSPLVANHNARTIADADFGGQRCGDENIETIAMKVKSAQCCACSE
jgi:hypothetical protein